MIAVLTFNNVNEFCLTAHNASRDAGWWHTSERYSVPSFTANVEDAPLYMPDPDRLSIPTKLCLIHSEIDEAYEGWLLKRADDHLPEWSSLAIECADVALRIGDTAGYLLLDMNAAVARLFANSFRGESAMSAAASNDMHGYISAAMEAFRKGKPGVAEGFAKTLITLDRIANMHGFSLAGAIAAKMAYNAVRADHKLEARGADGGKAF